MRLVSLIVGAFALVFAAMGAHAPQEGHVSFVMKGGKIVRRD